MITETQTTHTPGPWAVQHEVGAYLFTHSIQANIGRDDMPQFAVANVCVTASLDARECEANAHLIAAAPDLLAACKLALDSFGGLDTARLTAVELREYTALTLAIQKAGGQ